MEETKNNDKPTGNEEIKPVADQTTAGNEVKQTSETPVSETSQLPTPEKLEEEINAVVSKLVELMGIKAFVRTKINEDGSYYTNIRSRGADGLLIGKRGTIIMAIQAMLNQIFRHRYPTLSIDIFADVSGYRRRRENFLKKKALAVAKIVLETNREMALDILTEREFQMVEKELAQLGTVRIHSVGSGPKRTAVIAPL
ncbi:MAG: hypothetical protein N2748_01925 [candidate division WOR-3 bacterium]|nr:hypothetical protein [candidate division WOR-3 bacterium]